MREFKPNEPRLDPLISKLIEGKEKDVFYVSPWPNETFKSLAQLIELCDIQQFFKINYRRRTIEHVCNGNVLHIIHNKNPEELRGFRKI